MKDDSGELEALLAPVIHALHQTERCYRDCSRRMSDEVWRDLQHRYANQRSRFIAELRAELRRLTSSARPLERLPEVDRANTHRVDAERARIGNNDQALVNCCRQAEDDAIAAYRAALDHPLPDGLRDAVQRQLRTLEQAAAKLAKLANLADQSDTA